MRTYVTTLRQDSKRCLILKAEKVPDLPDDLASSIKDDDHYLVRAQLAVEGAVLVTTDAPLMDSVKSHGLQCMTREEFLAP